MNRTLPLPAALAFLALAGCVPDASSIQIRHAMWGVPDAACEVKKSETQKGAGFMDLGYTSRYWLALLVVSHLDTEALEAGGKPINPATRNDFYLSEIVLSYAGANLPKINEQVRATAGTVAAGGELFFATDLLTWEAAELLKTAAFPDGGLRVDVTIKLRGSYAHGASHETPGFVFPLTLTRDGRPACDNGVLKPAVESALPPCGNFGQDGHLLVCTPAAS